MRCLLVTRRLPARELAWQPVHGTLHMAFARLVLMLFVLKPRSEPRTAVAAASAPANDLKPIHAGMRLLYQYQTAGDIRVAEDVSRSLRQTSHDRKQMVRI